MSLFIASINSGSNGNCYYVGNSNEAILVDAGISCRETEKRMKRLGLAMKKVKAIFISHEHSDHINGVSVLSRKYQLPIYITPATLAGSRMELEPDLIKAFKAYEPIVVGKLTITAFPKFHDAAHAHSFTVSNEGIRVGVFTDIGVVCDHLQTHFSECHAAFLEANYDEDMLENGRYPYHLKRRISGGLGHLSNKQALALFLSHRPPYMSHLLLSHLSRDNNDPQMVHELFSKHADGTEIVVASRYQESAIYFVDGSMPAGRKPMNKIPESIPVQYSLF